MFKSFRFLVPGIVFIFSLPRFAKAQIDFEVPYPPDVEYYQEAPSASSQTLHVVGCNFTVFSAAGGSGLYMDIDDFNTSFEGDMANTRYLYGAMYDASPVSRMEITNDDGGTFDLHSIAVGTWPAGSTPWNTDQAVTIQGYRSGTAVTGVITEYVHYVGTGGYVQPAEFDVSADASFQGIDKIVISSPGIDLGEIEVDNINGVNLGDVVSAPIITPDANGVIYVDHSVSATGNGSSWTNAMKELGDALDSAASLNAAVAGTVKEIWVAKGTYKPTRIAGPDDGGGSTTSRDMAFVLVKDVKVYGGFSGTEASLDSRDLAKIHTDNETILSGDIGTSGDINDNVYHVVISTGAVGSALIDGFTVTAGNADGTEGFTNKIKINGEDIYRSAGGGMGLVNSSPSISNMIFTGNQANADGGEWRFFT